MKYLIALALLALSGVAGAQSLVNCAPATPCSSTTGPANTGTGDAAWKAFGKLNEDFSALSFGWFVSGSNTSAALVIGTGASLSATGSGTIAATTAAQLATAPAGCSGNQFMVQIDAFGNPTCSTPIGAGTVNTGLTGNVAYYASNATAVSPLVVGTNTLVGGIGSGTAALTAAQAIGVINSQTCNAQTASYTLVLGDANNCITENVASANALTLPPHSSVAFPVGTVETLEQFGAGATSITLGAGVTTNVQGPLVPTASLGGANGFLQLQQTATDNWTVTSYVPGNAKFTVAGSCNTPASTTGGSTGGTITMAASGTTASCTLIVTPGLTTQNLWVGSMADRTQLTLPTWHESAASTATITFTIPAAIAASDVLTFAIQPE